MWNKRLTILIAALILIFSGTVFFFYFSNEEYEEEENKTYPYEWAWQQRTFPYFNADPLAHFAAVKEAIELKNETRQRFLRKGQSQAVWQFAGPVNIGGRVVDIEFNPKDPDTIYAAAATGGVLKSTNGGDDWYSIFDDQASLTIGDIAVDPVNPEIIYVGTGEANGGHNNFPGAGIFKSTDAGATWIHKGLDSTASIGRILIDPKNTQRIFVAAVGSYFTPTPQRGVYFNNGGGDSAWVKSWFVSDSTGAIDIVMDTTNTNFMLAAMWERVRRPTSNHLYGPTSGIYRTFDGGVTWQKLGPETGLPNSQTQNIGRIGLAMCATKPHIIYALYNDGTEYTGLYKTTNYGTNWEDADPGNGIAGGTSNFSWFFGQVRVHPQDPNIVYALDFSLMRSEDGGLSWSRRSSSNLHVDHHALAFNPGNPDYIIEGNDGGINISLNGGNDWEPPAQIPVTQFYEIGLDYQNPQRLYGGTQDNYTIRTITGDWDDWEALIGGDGFYVLVDPTDANIIYAEMQFGDLGKSTDGGNSFSSVSSEPYGIPSRNVEPRNWSTPVVMDPNDSNVLYYGTNRIYRSTNKAESWVAISQMLTNRIYQTGFGTVTTIAVAPTNPNVIYAGTDDANFWVITNNGTEWVSEKMNNGLPYRWITRIVVDPKNGNIVYATFSGLKWKDPQPHVFRSTNMGNDWTDISSNLPDAPVNAFAVDKFNSNVLYLGNDVGAYISRNSGDSWEALGDGLPIVPVGDMKIHPDPDENFLVIGTYGRSMYKIDLNEVTSIENRNSQIPINLVLHQNYPNPFNPVTVISYQLPVAGKVKLSVFDILGKEIAVLVDEAMPVGVHKIEFNAAALSSGVYFYKLETKNFSKTKKMILMK